MDHKLRCNSLTCRQELSDHAVVTTCSHIFCIDCSNRGQLSGERENRQRICPACNMQLSNLDDVVVTNLNPSEDYKTSVLSGLSPNIIMECAGRALSFWAYQTTQEIVYQAHLAKNLQEKYAGLTRRMESLAREATGEISNLHNKMSSIQLDQENLRRKNEELMQAFREKSRKQLQTQELYDKLKRRAMLDQVQTAASNAVDDTIHASVTTNRFIDKEGNHNQRPTRLPLFQNMQSSTIQHPGTAASDGEINMAPPPVSRSGSGLGTWTTRPNSQEIAYQNQLIHTPSTHRQRQPSSNAPSPRIGLVNLHLNGNSNIPMSRRFSPSGRLPLAGLDGNTAAGSRFAGYGMSAGLKVSNPTAAAAENGHVRPVNGSIVAQRPSSGFPANRNPSFRPTSVPNFFSNGNGYY